MKRLSAIVIALVMCSIGSANAGLLGSTVEGTLAFGYPTVFGQYWSSPTQVVGAGQEFYYLDAANEDIADFSDTGLLISDLVIESANGWEMTFRSTAFIGATLVELSDSFTNGGVNYSISGDLLTFNWIGTGTTDGLLVAEYLITTDQVAAVPAPATLALFGFGLFGLVMGTRKHA